jgi:hypothetical protein
LEALAVKRAKTYKIKKRKALRAERNEHQKTQIQIPQYYPLEVPATATAAAAARGARLKTKRSDREKKRATDTAENERLLLERQQIAERIKAGGKQPVRRKCHVVKTGEGSKRNKKKINNGSNCSIQTEEISLVKDTHSVIVSEHVLNVSHVNSDSEPNTPIVNSVGESQRTPPQVKRRRFIIKTTPDSIASNSPVKAGTPALDSCSLVRGRLP